MPDPEMISEIKQLVRSLTKKSDVDETRIHKAMSFVEKNHKQIVTGYNGSVNEPAWSGPKAPIANAKKEEESLKKQDRSVFGYIEMPMGANPDSFAQCESCTQFTGKTCLNFGPDDKVKAGGACDYYVYGQPRPELVGEEASSVTPEEAGYVERPVRCENCFFQKARATRCGLYEYTNEQQPDEFDLDVNIKPTSCCNAQTASVEREETEHVKRRKLRIRKAKKGLHVRMEKLEKAEQETKQAIEVLSQTAKESLELVRVSQPPVAALTVAAELSEHMRTLSAQTIEQQKFLNESIATHNEMSTRNSALVDFQIKQQEMAEAFQKQQREMNESFQKEQKVVMETLVQSLTAKKKITKNVIRDGDGLIVKVEEIEE